MKKIDNDTTLKNKQIKRIYMLPILGVLLTTYVTIICSSTYVSAESIPIYLTQNGSDIDVTKDDTIPKDNTTLPLTNDEGIAGHIGILTLSIVGLVFASAYAISVHRKSKKDSV